MFFTFLLPLLIFQTFCFRNLQTEQQFSTFRIEIQSYVKSMATILQTNYDSTDCSCSTNTFYYECQGTDDLSDFPQFPRHQTCLADGVKMANRETIRLPGVIQDIDLNNLSCDKGAFLCHSKNFENMFEDQLKQNRKKRFAVTYVGSNTGVLIKHPGSYQNCDRDYDPRIRTWYVDGSTGLKNTIIFFKIKSSKYKNRAIQIGDYLVNTTNSGDWISLVDLNQCTETSCQIIRKGTSSTKNILVESINNIVVANKNWKTADYTNIGKQMKYFLENSGNRARNNFVIVADSVPDQASIQSAISSNNLDSYSPRFFPILIGTSANLVSIQNYTQSTNGLLIHDSNTSLYVNDVMNTYLTYFTKGLTIDRPVWSSVYEDAFGFGKLITVMMPSYDSNNTLLGVSGIDVTVEYLINTFGLQEPQIQDELADLYTYTESVVIMQSATSQGKASINWNNQGSQSTDICLGITIAGFIALMVCLFVGIPLIAVGAYCFIKWYKERQLKYVDNHDNINNN